MSIDNATPLEWSTAVRNSWVGQAKEQYDKAVKQFDEVTRPEHYNHGKYETIDVIIDTLGEYEAINYCHGNVLKYTIRMWHKGNPIKDAQKAQWYLNKMVELLEKTKGANW
jgi:hypothetical protein